MRRGDRIAAQPTTGAERAINDIGLPELGTLLIVASLVAMVSRRIGLPYTAGLVLAGIALAFLPIGVDLPLSRELIFNCLLYTSPSPRDS